MKQYASKNGKIDMKVNENLGDLKLFGKYNLPKKYKNVPYFDIYNHILIFLAKITMLNKIGRYLVQIFHKANFLL